MPVFRREQKPYQSAQVRSVARPPVATTPEPPVEITPPPPALTRTGEGTPAEPHPAAPPVNRAAAAVVDKLSEIKGTLHSKGNVLIEGIFQGEVEAKETVWVEKGAQTKAQIRANDAVISGSFDGEAECQHRLQIAATATISGEIKTPVLVVEEGATVNCRFSMTRPGRSAR
ncbi:MAG: polymer-forming cytoskeletal protein [Anaerolineae bacterium]|nr:polymer-forming cytoskeletal protein [Anaerolineae bacterium]